MKYDELKRRFAAEGLDRVINIRFDSLSGGYNGVCIAGEDDGSFTVNFCDERGAPFAEHPGMTEEDACKMVYSFAVNQREDR